MKARFILFTTLLCAFLLVAACSSDDEMADATLDSAAVSVAAPTPTTPTPDPLQQIDEDAPLAVISTRSLRVREEPSDTAKVIFAVKQREIFTVLALSADGKYLQLEIPDAPGGMGWVDTNFVTMKGDITNIERGVVPSTATPNATDEATAAAIALPSSTPLETPSQASSKPSSTETKNGTFKTATVKTDGQRLRVRKEPNADSAIVGRVTDGELVTILEESKDGKWAKIEGDKLDNPKGGWVAMEFLELKK